MENMDAMNYEYLIRRAYQCGRYGVDGANADIFRSLERQFALYEREKQLKEQGKPKEWNKSIEELAYEYGIRAGEIATHILSAINKVLDDYKEKLSSEQKEGLEKCKSHLFKPSMENIEKSIDEAQKIMLEIGLYPQ